MLQGCLADGQALAQEKSGGRGRPRAQCHSNIFATLASLEISWNLAWILLTPLQSFSDADLSNH